MYHLAIVLLTVAHVNCYINFLYKAPATIYSIPTPSCTFHMLNSDCDCEWWYLPHVGVTVSDIAHTYLSAGWTHSCGNSQNWRPYRYCPPATAVQAQPYPLIVFLIRIDIDPINFSSAYYYYCSGVDSSILLHHYWERKTFFWYYALAAYQSLVHVIPRTQPDSPC